MALRTRTQHNPSVVGGDAKLEDYLTKKGVSWEFLPNVEPDEFDAEKSLRNQACVFAPLDEKRVETYAEAMKLGDDFPPVLAYGKPGKYVLADGNHRLDGRRNGPGTNPRPGGFPGPAGNRHDPKLESSALAHPFRAP